MAQISRQTTVSTLKPYAKRFAKTYLAVAAVATIGWLVLYAVLIPDLVFDWFFGPVAVGIAIKTAVASTTVAAGSVAIFFAGVAYERYR